VTPVIIDTGVFAGGVFWRKEAHRCVNAWLQGMVALVVSAPIYQEYERTLRKIKAAYEFRTDVDLWLALVQAHGQWVQPCPLDQPVCRDPKDDIMIEAALAADAKTIIARDADLTVLEKPFGIQVLTPRAWLATLSRADRRKLK
jgi:putative PIN family toxin of toxin-antitoxin system